MTEQTYDNLDTEDLGKFYEENLQTRTCVICGGKIHPYNNKMQGDWWMLRSRVWVWKCGKCLFVGNLKDFDDKAARQAIRRHPEHPQSCQCNDCAVDQAQLERAEITAGLRCGYCRARRPHCQCLKLNRQAEPLARLSRNIPRWMRFAIEWNL